MTLILAATEATSDALGAAIATSTGLKILHPCRHTDVALVPVERLMRALELVGAVRGKTVRTTVPDP